MNASYWKAEVEKKTNTNAEDDKSDLQDKSIHIDTVELNARYYHSKQTSKKKNDGVTLQNLNAFFPNT